MIQYKFHGIEMDKIVHENRNFLLKTSDNKHNLMKKMGKYGKIKLKKYCKIQSLRPIGVPHDYFMVDRF